MMNIISHSRCKKCKKILNVMFLKDNPNGVGLVCIDKIKCKQNINKTFT